GRLLAGFEGGRIVVNVAEMPIKCLVAPHEMSFLLESCLRARGIREKSEIVFATPLPGAFTKPKASAVLGDMMGQRGIEVVADFNLDLLPQVRDVITAGDFYAMSEGAQIIFT
ncbi:MAG: hypothetical protein RIT45_3656, partial [Pseudomonadota bacterium]